MDKRVPNTKFAAPFISLKTISATRMWETVAMLSFFFGFHARLGRLHYVLCWIAFAVVFTMLCFAIAFSVDLHPPSTEPPEGVFTVPVLCMIPFTLCITVTLQSMRIRDIGWNPALVMPVWLLLIGSDMVVAAIFPELSIGKERDETIVGALINLGLTLVLLFWPSSDGRYIAPLDLHDTGRTRFASSEQPVTVSPSPRVVPNRAGFGRRGL